MTQIVFPTDEAKRLCAVYDLKILDTDAEERFDKITRRALEVFNVPISTITIIDQDREWYKSRQGITEHEAPRETSFCGHAIMQQDMMIIEDTLKDPNFCNNPQVTEPPHIRFYAGKSLYKLDNYQAVGVFCIKDLKPRIMSLSEIDKFLELSAQAEEELNSIFKISDK